MKATKSLYKIVIHAIGPYEIAGNDINNWFVTARH
jgi:hypothetical protein